MLPIQMKEIEFFGTGSSILRKSHLRNSGLDNLPECLSNSLDAWSVSNQKEKLNETVRSDEFMNSKLYTNTQKLQAIDIIDYSLPRSKANLN
jgi:hypothetical protein